MDENINNKNSRRKFLTIATSTLGGIGVGFAAIPFIASWFPSAKAKAMGSPVDIDISKIEIGQRITVEWRGQPIFIINRSYETIQKLDSLKDKLRDPDSIEHQQPIYATNKHRSIKDNILVITGICTHLGCVPLYKPKIKEIDPSWIGGFFCPCHGSKFDLAGRVYKGVPAPCNLLVPPHKYLTEKVLRIGEE
ncbi:MAG TPA: ubiquinol-cytochrome c reductase iron-sulfur subunit [Candidatus Azoamicus sp. OHIO1]